MSPTNTGFNALGMKKPVTASPAPMPSSQTMVCEFPDQIHPSKGSANKHTHPNCLNCRAEGDQFISANFTPEKVPKNTRKATEIAKNKGFANKFLPCGESENHQKYSFVGAGKQNHLRKIGICPWLILRFLSCETPVEKSDCVAHRRQSQRESVKIKRLTEQI